MEALNPQTEKKIKEIQKAILEKIDLKEIKKLKFGTTNKMNEWLKKNYRYFLSEELEYLEFTIPVEILDNTELKKTKTSQNNMVKTSDITTQVLLSSSPKDKMNFILSDDILSLLLNLYQNKTTVSIEKEDLKVPLEYSKLKDLKVTNCRLSADIYKRFVEYCEKNNFTITSLINYVLDDFLKRNK